MFEISLNKLFGGIYNYVYEPTGGNKRSAEEIFVLINFGLNVIISKSPTRSWLNLKTEDMEWLPALQRSCEGHDLDVGLRSDSAAVGLCHIV